MTLRKLAFFGSVLAGAAYLRDKNRRDRFLRSANDFLNSARKRLADFAPQQEMGAGTPATAGAGPTYTPPGGSSTIY